MDNHNFIKSYAMRTYTPKEIEIIKKTEELLGQKVIVGSALKPFLTSFRGKKGYALGTVSPKNTTELYKLIKLYKTLSVGYLLQGANTALKGQSTPNGSVDSQVIIIRTNNLKKYKILDYPNNSEFKILLVEPGLCLKEAEKILNPLGYDLPHKTGSHDLGNTFGASCANGCGGVRVDNRDGRASMTKSGNMGVVAISTDGIIYNGFIRKSNLNSGKELLNLIDNNAIEINDIELPDIEEINNFLKKLFEEKNYPIHNHRGKIIFAGDGGEGLQAIIYQMYLVRKKPYPIKTYAIMFNNLDIKEHFYREMIFKQNINNVDALPILCESMNHNLVKTIVKDGVGYFMAIATTIKKLNQYAANFLKLRNFIINLSPTLLIKIESLLGQALSKIFTPKVIYKLDFAEMVLLQVANRQNSIDNIRIFEDKLVGFINNNSSNIKILTLKPNSFKEKILLHIRNISAMTTLNMAIKTRGELFSFDDAIMPGKMTWQYCNLLLQKLSAKFPDKILLPYVFGHDLKQINHNDWVITKKLTHEEVREIYKIQHLLVKNCGGIAHAEHGFGDYADISLNRHELVKLVAHRLLNDVNGLANLKSGFESAFNNAILDNSILSEALEFAKKSIQREIEHGTLFTWLENEKLNLMEILNCNFKQLFKV